MNKELKAKLIEAIRETMSPQAVATVIAGMFHVDGTPVEGEIQWFKGVLIETVGGVDSLNDLYEECGL